MATQNIFAESLFDSKQFTITYELVPGQGSGGRRVEKILEFAAEASKDGRIKALSITDNPGGHPAMAPIAIGSEIHKAGIEPLLHFSLKDKNRSQIESHLFLYHRQHFSNLLVLGGDFPRVNYHGQAKPVFDLDTIQTLQLMRDMEEGTYRSTSNPARPTFDPIAFNRGCVVSPFKTTEPEQVWQYAKLLQKIRTGAHFIVTQLGYDICKFEELIRFLKENNFTVPVLGNVFVPSLAVARYMGEGQVPGIVFPNKLIELMKQEKVSQNSEARLIRAAKLICVLKGLGYSGVHLGGNGLNFDNVKFILDSAEELNSNWDMLRPEIHFPVTDTWYLYPPARTGSCGTEKINLHPGRNHKSQRSSRIMHSLLFSPPKLSSRLFGKLCLFCSKTRNRTALLRTIERWSKVFLFYCRMCGDCTLAESTYICPQSGCPKNLLNGPCGGSRNQTCEVFPDRFCFWIRVYNRVDPDSTLEQLGSRPFMQPKNWALDQTSSWINFYSGNDHKEITFAKNKK